MVSLIWEPEDKNEKQVNRQINGTGETPSSSANGKGTMVEGKEGETMESELRGVLCVHQLPTEDVSSRHQKHAHKINSWGLGA